MNNNTAAAFAVRRASKEISRTQKVFTIENGLSLNVRFQLAWMSTNQMARSALSHLALSHEPDGVEGHNRSRERELAIVSAMPRVPR
jgi:hypothetical protein